MRQGIVTFKTGQNFTALFEEDTSFNSHSFTDATMHKLMGVDGIIVFIQGSEILCITFLPL